ncbi:cytochrome c3 family protein [Chloroflexota bacterium]
MLWYLSKVPGIFTRRSLSILLTAVLAAIIVLILFCYRIDIASADPGEYLNEAHFRIGDDTPLSAMEWHESTDTKTTGIRRNENFRVRFQIYNTNASKSWLPQLEFLETEGSWTEVLDSSGSRPFFINTTAEFDHNDSISTDDFALGTGTGSAQNGRAYSATPTDNFTLGANSYTEIEFNIQPNDNADYYTPYSFRVTDDGVVFDSYNNTAVVSVWESDNTSSPHYGYSNITAKCATCHRLHTGTGQKLRATWPEESLCNTCHDATGSRTDIEDQFTGKTYYHPVSANEGVHTTQEGSYGWLPASSRHVECEDCHNPHGSQTGASTPSFGDLSRTIESTWGVNITNPTTAWTALTSGNYARFSAVTAEYQLCLKCHSSYAYSTTPPPSISGITETDQALEFNVNNASYHWVETDKTAVTGDTPRTNSSTRDMSFVPGSVMAKDTPMGCSNCHASDVANEPRGPHGSDNAYLLKGTWSDAETGTDYSLCLQCHDPDVYGPGGSYTADMTNFAGFYRKFSNTDPAPNLHVYHWTRSGVYGCQNCHSAVPHGGQNRALLVESGDGAPYDSGSRLGISSWDPGGTWIWSDCSSSVCH